MFGEFTQRKDKGLQRLPLRLERLSYFIVMAVLFSTDLSWGRPSDFCRRVNESLCSQSDFYQELAQWGCDNLNRLEELDSFKILKGEGAGIKESTWDFLTMLSDKQTWIGMHKSLHGTAVECFEEYEGHILPWLGCLQLKFGRTLVQSFLTESAHCTEVSFGEQYQPEEAGKCIGRALSALAGAGIAKKGAQALALRTVDAPKQLLAGKKKSSLETDPIVPSDLPPVNASPLRSLDDPSRLVVGELNQVVEVYSSEGVTYHVAEAKAGGGYQLTGFEGGGLSRIRPEVLTQLGIFLKEGKLHFPGDAESINKKLSLYYETLPPELRSNLKYFNAKGQISAESYLRNWSRGFVPLATKTREHFHDICVHLEGYILLPQKVAEKTKQNIKQLLSVYDHPLLSKNQKLKDILNMKMREVTETLDRELASIAGDILKDHYSSDWLQIRFNRIANTVHLFDESEMRQLGLSTQEYKILKKMNEQIKTSSTNNSFAVEAEQLLKNNPIQNLNPK